MIHALEAFAVLVVIFFAVGVPTALALVVRALRRANHVVPNRRSPAPLGWLWSWRQAARLHRRLVRAAHVARVAIAPLAPVTSRRRAAGTTPLHEVAGELVSRAVLVDEWLVQASVLDPYWRRQRLAELSVEVRDLERSACRLQQVSSHWRLSLDRAAQAGAIQPPNLRERLDAVEAALAELQPGALTPGR